MNFLRKIASISFLVVALLLACSSYGLCSQITISETELNELSNNLTQLENNNKELLSLLQEQNESLITASQNSMELKNQLTVLQGQLIESQRQIRELRNLLIEAQKSTSEAKNSLETANKELAEASKSLKKLEHQRKSIEFKNKILKVAVLGLIGVIAIRG